MGKNNAGELYDGSLPEILREQQTNQDLMAAFNAARPSEPERKQKLLREMLGTCGEGVYVEAPFYANFGGRHCHFADHVYVNFGLICVDDADIFVGEETMIGPRVTLSTAGHPLLPELRKTGLQFSLPIHIGKRCWLGAGAIVLPGVTIGDGTTIGAGSVVTHDIPAGVLALGVPCRVVREIGEYDREFYRKDRKIDWDEIRGPEGPEEN